MNVIMPTYLDYFVNASRIALANGLTIKEALNNQLQEEVEQAWIDECFNEDYDYESKHDERYDYRVPTHYEEIESDVLGDSNTTNLEVLAEALQYIIDLKQELANLAGL